MYALTGKSLNFRQFINYSYPELRLQRQKKTFDLTTIFQIILIKKPDEKTNTAGVAA
jgi:hypothetical protein